MTVQRNDDSSPQSSLRSPSWFYTSFTSNVTTTPSDRRTTIHVRTSAIPSDYSVSLSLPYLPFSVLCVGWFPNLTRAYDNNGRCPRQKFVLGILQLLVSAS